MDKLNVNPIWFYIIMLIALYIGTTKEEELFTNMAICFGLYCIMWYLHEILKKLE